MKQTLKKIEDSVVEVTVEVDSKLWEEAQIKARKDACKDVQLKGFRKGEAPEALAIKHIDPNKALDSAINSMLNPAFADVLREQKLNPFMRPEVAVTKVTPTELELKFTVTLVPEVTLGEYKGLSAAKEAASVNDADVEAAINAKLAQSAVLTVVDREAKKGDTVTLDFEGFVDGVAFEGGKAQNYALELGSNSFVPGFEDSLVGVKTGDKKDVVVTFPEHYVANLAGKVATFKCKIHEIKEKVTPELNDETVKDMGIKGVETVDALRESEKARLLNQKVGQVNQAYFNAILAQIVAGAKVAIAPVIVDNEAKQMQENMVKQIESNGLTLDQYCEITGETKESLSVRFHAEAEQNIKTYLCLEKIAEVEAINVTDEEVEFECQKVADQYKMELKDVKNILLKEGSNFRADLRNRKITDFVMNVSKIAGSEKKAPAKKAAAKPAAEKPAAEKKPAAKKAPAKKAAAKKAE